MNVAQFSPQVREQAVFWVSPHQTCSLDELYRPSLLREHPSPSCVYPPKEEQKVSVRSWNKKNAADVSKAEAVISVFVCAPTETMSSGLSLGGSAFGVSAGNESTRALRASWGIVLCGGKTRDCALLICHITTTEIIEHSLGWRLMYKVFCPLLYIYIISLGLGVQQTQHSTSHTAVRGHYWKQQGIWAPSAPQDVFRKVFLWTYCTLEGAEGPPAFWETLSKAFSILAFLSAGGAAAEVWDFCNRNTTLWFNS